MLVAIRPVLGSSFVPSLHYGSLSVLGVSIPNYHIPIRLRVDTSFECDLLFHFSDLSLAAKTHL
ncbi:hypothetical protein Plhal304r1_c018g0063551 [Plasmopara halstedii]